MRRLLAPVLATFVVFVALAFVATSCHARLYAQGQPVEALTEMDKLRIENVNLYDALTVAIEEADTCRGLLAKPRADANRSLQQQRWKDMKAAIQAAHPGFSFEPSTGGLTPTAR